MAPPTGTRRSFGARAGALAGSGALAPFLASCGAQAGGGSVSGGAQPVKLGSSFALTGAAAVYGTIQRKAVELAVEEINGQNTVPGVKLDVVYEDDAGAPPTGITVFQKLINQDKVMAIIGPTLSNVALAADPVAQQAQVPVLGVSNTANGVTDIGTFIFRDSLTDAVQIPGAVKKAVERRSVKRAAIFFGNDDAFTKTGGDEFKKALEANRVQIASTQTFAHTDKDFAAQLTQIKSANPDAIFVAALIAAAVGIVTQARQLLGEAIPIVGNNGFNSPVLTRDAGKAAEGVIIGAAWHISSANAKSQAFTRAFKAKFNQDPDQFAAQAYAGVYILAEAIRKAGATPTRDAIRRHLGEIKSFPTVLGSFSFNAQRDAEHPPVVQIVRNGQFAVLE
jgi:branched-chain amino acid transport system substrate-binding protein